MRRDVFCPGSLVSRVVVAAACMAGLSPAAASSAESPPVGEPREKLTINGKEVFEGRRVLFDYRSDFNSLLDRSAADGDGPRDGKQFAVGSVAPVAYSPVARRVSPAFKEGVDFVI